MFLTIFPVIFFFGMVFTEEGRARLKENFLIVVYFIVAFGYFYIFWFNLEDLVEYTKLEVSSLSLVYGLFACAPMIKSSLPN